MATRLIARLTGTGPTAVQVAASNPGRMSLMLRVNNATLTSFGASGVTASTGFPWGKDDGIYQDSVAATDALYMNAPSGAPMDVSVWEITA